MLSLSIHHSAFSIDSQLPITHRRISQDSLAQGSGLIFECLSLRAASLVTLIIPHSSFIIDFLNAYHPKTPNAYHAQKTAAAACECVKGLKGP